MGGDLPTASAATVRAARALNEAERGERRAQPLPEAVDGGRVDAGFSWTLRRSDETRTLVCQLNVGEPVASGIDAVAEGAQRVTGTAAAAIARSVNAARANPAATACPP